MILLSPQQFSRRVLHFYLALLEKPRAWLILCMWVHECLSSFIYISQTTYMLRINYTFKADLPVITINCNCSDLGPSMRVSVSAYAIFFITSSLLFKPNNLLEFRDLLWCSCGYSYSILPKDQSGKWQKITAERRYHYTAKGRGDHSLAALARNNH